jgi:hypothetical protein
VDGGESEVWGGGYGVSENVEAGVAVDADVVLEKVWMMTATTTAKIWHAQVRRSHCVLKPAD